MYLFADDVKIYDSINSLIDHDIDDVTKFTSDWLVTYNPDKYTA